MGFPPPVFRLFYAEQRAAGVSGEALSSAKQRRIGEQRLLRLKR